MTKLHIESLVPLFDKMLEDGGGLIPWTAVGIFPTADSPGPPEAWWNSFVYTVGMTPGVDMWMPCTSIEGRYMGPNLTAYVVNTLACAWRASVLLPHDDVIVPLGVPDKDDVDCVVWVGRTLASPAYRQANMSPAEFIIPLAWSSGLGWPEDVDEYVTKTGKVLTEEDIEALAEEAERGYEVTNEMRRRKK